MALISWSHCWTSLICPNMPHLPDDRIVTTLRMTHLTKRQHVIQLMRERPKEVNNIYVLNMGVVMVRFRDGSTHEIGLLADKYWYVYGGQLRLLKYTTTEIASRVQNGHDVPVQGRPELTVTLHLQFIPPCDLTETYRHFEGEPYTLVPGS